jgi:hypothetical protein
MSDIAQMQSENQCQRLYSADEESQPRAPGNGEKAHCEVRSDRGATVLGFELTYLPKNV